MTTTAPARKGLSTRTIAALVDARQPGMWSHRQGLHLFISPAGTASWAFRYTAKGGRRRLMMLQPVDDVSAPGLKIMESRAASLKLQVKAGHDPMAERDGERKTPETARKKVETFKEFALKYVAEQSPSWKSTKHGDQWTATLTEYTFDQIGDKSPVDITAQDIWDLLHQPHKVKGAPIIECVTETASRVRMRVEAVIQHALELNPETENRPNPARLTRSLKNKFALLNKRAKKHFKAMQYQDVPAFVAELENKPDFSARAPSW